MAITISFGTCSSNKSDGESYPVRLAIRLNIINMNYQLMRSIVLGSLEDFKEYEESWELLRKGCKAPIFASYDLVRLWLDNFKAEVKPCIVLIEDKGELVSAAPLCTSHARAMGLPVRSITMVGELYPLFGYSLYSILAKEDSSEAIGEMVKCVMRAKWNKLYMPYMETSSYNAKFLEGINQMCGGQSTAPSPSISHYYAFPLEGNVTSNFGKSTRANLRRLKNKLEREGRMEFRKVESVNDAERAMHLYLSQHQERWDSTKTQFRYQSNCRQVLALGKLAVETGIGEITELLIDGEVAAQLLCLFDGDVVHGIRVGMTDKFREFSPGLMAIALTMEQQRKRGLKVFDPGVGNDAYKLRITNSHRELGSALAYRGTMGIVSRVRSFPAIKVLENRLMPQDKDEKPEINSE